MIQRRITLRIAQHMGIVGHYNPSVRITASILPPQILRGLILYANGGAYSLTLTPNDKFLRSFSLQVLSEICCEELPEEIFFLSYLVPMSDMTYEHRLYV